MKNKIRQALQANDIPSVRTLLIDMMTAHAGQTKTVLEISETIASTPDLFDPDDGKSYPAPHELSEENLSILAEDLRENFSLPKFRLFTEVQARIVRDPNFSLKHYSQQTPDTSFESNEQLKNRPLQYVGYILMALGVIATIVAICVPLRFLIGVGIGVLMLGLAVAYSAIPR